MDDVVRIENVTLVRQRISMVKEVKKAEMQQVNSMAMMRQAPQLFAYKFYKKQLALDLPFEKLNEV